MKISKTELIDPAVISIAITLFYSIYNKFIPGVLLDGLSISALILLSIGLSRVAGNLGFFHSTKFGFAKFWEIVTTKGYSPKTSKYPTLNDYIIDNPYTKKWQGFILLATMQLCLCMISIFL